MPFSKRTVEPQLICRHPIPNEDGLLFEDLCSINNLALSRTLRQLSDLAKHACSIFQELEHDVVLTSQRVRGLQNKISKLQHSTSALDPKQEAVPVSNLDVESKLTAHYQAPWHLQRNIFLPSTRPPCVDDLHREAKLSLRALQRGHLADAFVQSDLQKVHVINDSASAKEEEHQQRRASSRERRVTICVSVAPPTPSYPSPRIPRRRKRRGSNVSTALPSDPDSELVLLGHRSKAPVPNVPSTLDRQTNWSSALPLPTPAERMKSDSQVISSCVIPINVTGVGFDRDSSVRSSLVHSQSLLQRRRKLRRRRTVAGVPRQVQQHFDSDESPGSRERTVIIHTSPDTTTTCSEELASRLSTTRDSGCQTEDFPISGTPARRRIRAQRGPGGSHQLSVSAGNISSLPDRGAADDMFGASVDARLRSRSLPREGVLRLADRSRAASDEDEEEEEELSPFETEDFLSRPGELHLKDEEGSTDDQAAPGHRQLGSLVYKQHADSPEHRWLDRARSRLPSKAHMGSCEISSSSDTFSSPVHSVSAAGVLAGQMDHKDDHQSSSGNWSGSSSTCPSQTSETIPPAASPPLTGSSHCDSELSLNAASHVNDDPAGFVLDHYPMERFPGLRRQRAGSYSSTAMDILEDAGMGTASEGEWSYPHSLEPACPQSFSPEPSREAEGSLGCPSFTSMTTCESSYSDKPPSEKADTVSHYSVDTEGYYTSMHFDCGLKGSRSFTYNYAAGSDCGHPDIIAHASHSRLSLKKSRAKPSPPKRSSSLRQICSEGNLPERKEPKISCGQQPSQSSKERKLQLDLGGSLCGTENPSLVVEPMDAWGVEGCGELQDLQGGFSPMDAHSFKDDGVVQSDYADLWLLNDLKSNDTYRSLSNSSTATGTTVVECIKSQESSGSQTSQSDSRATTPSLPSVEGEFKLASPENLAGLASPSSGYSSQSETPTSTFPSAFFPSPLSPSSGKRKPKVPERKSSLSSLQVRSSRDGGSSPENGLELPIIPPPNLDLSGLHHSAGSTPLALRNQVQLLKQSKQKALLSTNLAQPEAPGKPQNRLMAITPTVLHSVQLKSFSKEKEKVSREKAVSDAATRPKGPTVNTPSTLSGSISPEFKGHPVYATFLPSSFQEPCQLPFLPHEGPRGGSEADVCHRDVSVNQDKQAPAHLGSVTAFLPQSSEREDVCHGGADNKTTSVCPEGGMSGGPTSSPLCCSTDSRGPEAFPSPYNDPSDEEPPYLRVIQAGSVSSQDNTASRSEDLDKVAATNCHSEASQLDNGAGKGVDYESSGVSSLSASQDSREESSPDCEEDFGKETTPGEDVMSPLGEDMSKLEDDSVFLSPSKARTTEDLFAMIHRSKRKVLGRRDSAEVSARSRLGAASGATPPGTPVAPTPPAPPTPPPASPATPAGLQKAPSPIYRSVKKSSTSNEEFKLLLLRKGSRSDSGYRMSAAEILRGPAAPKSPAGDPLSPADGPGAHPEEPLSPFRPPGSPGPGQPLDPFPKANAEGFFSPRACSQSAATANAPARPGRSRIPPPANSSRYGVRGRFYTMPMQAISEGETENSDGSPHDDSRSSSGSS